ncbi:type II toxin-antitoxin system mRNA interferase toxin, RelE/StbE family [candidate division WOR-3 bacterium JGI_Cruoil_03_51_56]|uniref:Type II toxin-antitoxin system mRNA interferase toxin, RelE/StbE family n=1 Tax=candidate division WOR-3 bacterium JGI_Cruoil_03_51_56 TaxID=1973747 RepID=A0A235BYE7_UNCW3|nr:MAG: type II toxin-antitoxin system mRNA interferase toxin, RelE/StbE family [candidate division WOR-3 bacterium JGI_Cruoil_03_51_56]
MNSYELRWKSSAERDLRKTDLQQISRIIKAVESLADNPFPPQHRKLRGSEHAYRIRVGDYRVIYHVDTGTRNVTVYHVRHRREAYRR